MIPKIRGLVVYKYDFRLRLVMYLLYRKNTIHINRL